MEPTPPVSAFAEDDARLAGMHGYAPVTELTCVCTRGKPTGYDPAHMVCPVHDEPGKTVREPAQYTKYTGTGNYYREWYLDEQRRRVVRFIRMDPPDA